MNPARWNEVRGSVCAGVSRVRRGCDTFSTLIGRESAKSEEGRDGMTVDWLARKDSNL